MDIRLDLVPLGESIDRNDFILFSESNTRFLVEVALENKEAFEKNMEGTVFAAIGEVNGAGNLNVYGSGGREVVSVSIGELKGAWQKPLRW